MVVTAQNIVWLALTQQGFELAQQLRSELKIGVIHGLKSRTRGADIEFADTIEHIGRIYSEGSTVVGVCASGILIRAVAAVMAGKHLDSPLISMAEDGSCVVPLLGGHRGANSLADKIAKSLAIKASITTTSDRRFAVALDNPPQGWTLANPGNYKSFAAALLSGATTNLVGNATWLENSKLPFEDRGYLELMVTEESQAGSDTRLVYHPQTLALGVGCERNIKPDELIVLAQRTLAERNLSAAAVAVVCSIDVKADEAAVHAVADFFKVPARFLNAATLELQSPRLENPSETVFQEVGCHGVAEAAALAVVGETGELLVSKRKSVRATCAVAKATDVLRPTEIGQARGCLTVVGIGPGSDSWRTPAVSESIRKASDLVGYQLYLDLISSLTTDQNLHGYQLGEETTRVDFALELASQGKKVALICSGDPGIYAMATLVFERLKLTNNEAWQRTEIKVEPGISALQAAAARCGAPLGHDFCAISLSNLLTSWDVIEERIRAAALGDFVVAFYNPVSQKRDWQLDKARQILLQHRPADTPVVVARNLGRNTENIDVCELGELKASMVDMLTIVLVGSSQTRSITQRNGQQWVYTPRGYADKVSHESAA